MPLSNSVGAPKVPALLRDSRSRELKFQFAQLFKKLQHDLAVRNRNTSSVGNLLRIFGFPMWDKSCCRVCPGRIFFLPRVSTDDISSVGSPDTRPAVTERESFCTETRPTVRKTVSTSPRPSRKIVFWSTNTRPATSLRQVLLDPERHTQKCAQGSTKCSGHPTTRYHSAGNNCRFDGCIFHVFRINLIRNLFNSFFHLQKVFFVKNLNP